MDAASAPAHPALPGPELPPGRRAQAGFTLIELIAVIIILGILAAVIAPRYFNMTDAAQNSALDAASSEAVSRLYQSYAARIIASGGSTPANLAALQGTSASHLGADLTAVNMGDYQAKFEDGTGTAPNVIPVKITLSRRAQDGTVTAITNAHASRSVAWPGN